MTCREIFAATLRLLCETEETASDYEERASYLLATLCTELSSLDNKYRAERGEGPMPPFAKAFLELDQAFPLSDAFLPVAEYYLASMLAMEENEELGDRYFAKYSDALASIMQPRTEAKPIKDRYRLI